MVATGDSKSPVLDQAKAAAVACCGEPTLIVKGGAGAKILAVAQGEVDIALMHAGTSLWDSCAPEAILHAVGGTVTDLFGAPLRHDASSGDMMNRFGVIASGPGYRDLHQQLCLEMGAAPAVRALRS